MPSYRSPQAQSSSSTSTAASPPVADVGGMAGTGGDPPVACTPVDPACSTDPWPSMLSAIDAGDGCQAWGFYQQLSSEQQTRLFSDHTTQRRLVAVTYPAIGMSSFDTITLDLCLSPLGTLLLARDAAIADETVVTHVVAGPTATADGQASLLRNPEAAAVIVTALGGRRADQALAALAAVPASFVGACLLPGTPFANWVFRTDADFTATFAAIPDLAAWFPVFFLRNDWERVLRMASDAASGDMYGMFQSNPAVMAWVCVMATKPLPDGPLLTGFQILFGDGFGFPVATKYLAFQVLYGDKLGHAGSDWDRDLGADSITWNDGTTTNGHQWRKYHVVDPNDQAMTWFFDQFGQLPRSHVGTVGQILMVDNYTRRLVSSGNPDYYMDGSGSTTAAATNIALTTSYYTNENKILMRSLDATGTPDSDIVADEGTGAGKAPGAVNRQGAGNPGASATPDMNYFQNHATHEMGHSVGARPLNLPPLSGSTGNAWCKTAYGWDAGGTSEGYARTLGFTSAMDASTYRLRDASIAVDLRTTGAVVREFLAQWSAGNKTSPAALVDQSDMAKFPDPDSLYTAIQNHAGLKATLLFKTVDSNRGDADNAYEMTNGISAGSGEVHFWCTRWDGPNTWAKYTATAWQQKPSHYATSSPGEYFAELYTAHYTGGRVNATAQPVFDALDRATPADFGALPAPAAAPGTPAAGPSPIDDPAGAAPSPVGPEPGAMPGHGGPMVVPDSVFTGLG